MTAKEKAENLIKQYKGLLSNIPFGKNSEITIAKQCATICINEKIELLEYVCGSKAYMWTSHEKETYNYLLDVKECIKKY